MSFKFINCILVIFYFFSPLCANDKVIEPTQNLTISDGLAHNGVTAILEDSKGYIWIATYDGLNRYDGYEFKVFKNTINREFFVSNRIRCLTETSDGNIWIGTDEGLTIYNYVTEHFQTIFSHKITSKDKADPIVREILENQENGKIVCVTEDAGLLIFNQDYSLFAQYDAPLNQLKEPVVFYGFDIIDNSFFLVYGSDGVFVLDTDKGEYKNIYRHNITSKNGLLKVTNDSYLIAKQYGLTLIKYKTVDGLLRISYNGHNSIEQATVNQYLHDKYLTQSVSANFISSIVRLPNDELGVELYPNPFTSQLTIILPANHQYHTITLLDGTGRIIYTNNVPLETHIVLESEILESLQKGEYLIQLSDKKSTAVLKVCK